MPERDVDPTQLFNDLVRVETEVWNAVDQRLRSDHGLPLSWFEPMQVVDRLESGRVGEIAAALRITVGGASKLSGRIERAGYMHRRPASNDRRATEIALTEAGRKKLAAAERTHRAELERRLGRALPRSSLRQLGSALRRLREAPVGAEVSAA